MAADIEQSNSIANETKDSLNENDKKIFNKLNELEKVQKKDVGASIESFLEGISSRYSALYNRIITSSFSYLKTARNYKNSLRWLFSIFAWCFLSVQYIALIILVICLPPEKIGFLITLATKDLAETFTIIIAMVKSIFNDKHEEDITRSICKIASSYSDPIEKMGGKN